MSTYAYYRVWVGFLKENADELPAEVEEFIEELEKQYDGVEREDYTFQSISMHSETICYGVEMTELDWKARGEAPDELDHDVYRNLEEMVDEIKHVLYVLGLPTSVPVKAYHHIDLGG